MASSGSSLPVSAAYATMPNLPPASSKPATLPPLIINEKIVVSPTTGTRKRILSCVNANYDSKQVIPVKLVKNMASPGGHRPRRRGKKQKQLPEEDFVNNSPSKDSTSMFSDSDEDTMSQSDSPIQGTEFEVEVKTALRRLTKGFFGDKKTKSIGLIRRVTDVETELYGEEDKPETSLKVRVQNLESAIIPAPGDGTVPALSTGPSTSDTDVAQLQQSIQNLTESNEVLAGFASRLQSANRSLQNQLFVQHDRQNFLNLHLGGVDELQDKSPKEEAAAFFNKVLQLKEVTPGDFIKAYRKSNPREYEETVKSEDGSTKNCKYVLLVSCSCVWNQRL